MVFAVIAVVACKGASKSEPTPRDPGAGSDAASMPGDKAADAPRDVLAIETSRGRTALVHGKAYLEGTDALEIRLTDVPGPCGSGFKPPWRAAVFVTVPPGPAGRFYAGAPFGTKVSGGEVGGPGDIFGYAPQAMRLTLEPFTLRAGETIRGTLAMSAGAGAFAAEVCPGDYSPLAALPADAPAAPVSGTVANQPFVAKRAVITVDKQSETYRQIGQLVLFATPAGSCETARDHVANDRGAPAIAIMDIGGASSTVALVGSPQPAAFVVRPDTEDRGAAWVQLEELVLEPGRKLRGRLALANRSKATAVAGTALASR